MPWKSEDPNDWWFNNPLISASTKVDMFNEAMREVKAAVWDAASRSQVRWGAKRGCSSEIQPNPYRKSGNGAEAHSDAEE